VKHVLGPGADFQVLQPVIAFVPIDVVDVKSSRVTDKSVHHQNVDAVTAAFVLSPQ
jgi:hypothetical protein